MSSTWARNEPSTELPREDLRVASQSVDTSALAAPITFHFSGRTAKNRFMKAPLTERLCQWNEEDEPIEHRGYPTAEYARLYARWSEGEIGVIVTGNIMVQYDAVEAYGNPVLVDDHDGRVARFKEVTDVAHKHGSLIIAQLSHPGRQGRKSLNPYPVSASDIHLTVDWASKDEFAPPRPLSIAEIKDMVKRWGQTAALCYNAGFDGVQLHCAHGYLLSQFLSPNTNRRMDEYGGEELTNRARIIFEIIHEIRRRISDPSFIICVKLNSVEFQDKGLMPADSRALCVQLEAAQVDFVDLSGGTFESRAFYHAKESTRKREAYFIEFAETIRPLLSRTKVYITGGLRTVQGMAAALTDGACDGIGLGRPITAEPYLCRHILAGAVTGALESFVPPALSIQASGTQIYQVSIGEELVSNWGVKSEVRRFERANEEETARRTAILPKVDSSGYPHIKAEIGYAYLTA